MPTKRNALAHVCSSLYSGMNSEGGGTPPRMMSPGATPGTIHEVVEVVVALEGGACTPQPSSCSTALKPDTTPRHSCKRPLEMWLLLADRQAAASGCPLIGPDRTRVVGRTFTFDAHVDNRPVAHCMLHRLDAAVWSRRRAPQTELGGGIVRSHDDVQAANALQGNRVPCLVALEGVVGLRMQGRPALDSVYAHMSARQGAVFSRKFLFADLAPLGRRQKPPRHWHCPS